MPEFPKNNISISNAQDFLRFQQLAAMELCGDKVLYARQYGETPSLTAGVEEDIWTPGGALSYLSSAETMDIVSTSAADAPGGAGVGAVQIKGLDADYNPIDEVILLNGTTPVTTVNSYLRVYMLIGIKDGATGETNAGTITATASTAATVQARMEIGTSLSQMVHFTIPAGYTAFVTEIVVIVFKGNSGASPFFTNFTFKQRVNEIQTVFSAVDGGASSTVPAVFQKSIPLVVNEKDDLWITATAEKNGTVVGCQYDMLLIKGNFNNVDVIL